MLEDFVISVVQNNIPIKNVNNNNINLLCAFIAHRRVILLVNVQKMRKGSIEKEVHALDAALSGIY